MALNIHDSAYMSKLSHPQSQSATGALVGAAVGDALGAPFEFKPANTYAQTFPDKVLGGVGEMIGGGAFHWAPGEFTDDTQMALALAESLIACGLSFEPESVWKHFASWAVTATDIGKTTRAALRGREYSTAAEEAHDLLGQSGGNGSVMRIAPVGIAGVRWGSAKTIAVARAQSDLTHFDEGAGWGAAIVAELIRRLIVTQSKEESFFGLTNIVPEPHKSVYEKLLAPDWTPDQSTRPGNGSVWICVAQAVWSVHTTNTFEDAITTAINLGGDTDTVAAVTGAIAGALYGVQQIPSRWLAYVHGCVSQPDGEVKKYVSLDLQTIAHRLVGRPLKSEHQPEPAQKPLKVHPVGVFAANLEGAVLATPDQAVISLCRTGERFASHPYRREVYIIDQEKQHNPYLAHAVNDAVTSIERFLHEGREVVVHCFGGRSRTGLILKAWYMRHHDVGHAEAHAWLEKEWHLYATWNESFFTFLDNHWNR